MFEKEEHPIKNPSHKWNTTSTLCHFQDNTTCQLFEKEEQPIKNTSQDGCVLFQIQFSLIHTDKLLMFEKEEHPINSPSHNGTPLLLHDPFWIWLPLIDVLTSCQHLKKNNIQSRTPPTMECHLCFLLFQDTAVCCPWKQIKTVLSLLHSTVVIHDSKKEQHDQVVHPQENTKNTEKIKL